MGAFPRIYSDAQREALQHAWAELGIRPAARITALAAAGELKSETGEPLEAFHVPEQTVRDVGRRYMRRRAGLERSRTAELPARDAIEALRRRLVAAAEHELDAMERSQARRRPVNPERLRQVARVVREIAALPATDSPAPGKAPEPGRRTRGGLAGQILKASQNGAVHEPTSRAQHDPAGETPEPTPTTGGEPAPGEGINRGEGEAQHEAPGSAPPSDSPAPTPAPMGSGAYSSGVGAW